MDDRVLRRHVRHRRGGGTGPRVPRGRATRPLGTYDITIDHDMARRYAEVSGDWSEHHFDVEAAVRSGFERPFLHGLCTMALCSQAVVDLVAGGDPARVCGGSQSASQPRRSWARHSTCACTTPAPPATPSRPTRPVQPSSATAERSCADGTARRSRPSLTSLTAVACRASRPARGNDTGTGRCATRRRFARGRRRRRRCAARPSRRSTNSRLRGVVGRGRRRAR